MTDTTSSVFTAIVGRPNVGKSSLLNHLVGERVAIVTDKPQTTRTRITGILTQGAMQYVFLDTPGMHYPRTKLGSRMERTVKETLKEGDAILMLFDPFLPLNESERGLVADIGASKIPAIALVNKVDMVADRDVLETKLEEIRSLGVFQKVMLTSASLGTGCKEVLDMLDTFAVPGPHFFAADEYTDQPERQLVAEIIREKLLVNLRQEIPHGTAVEIDRFHEREDKPLIEIEATIYCEKKSHKGMIIGKDGQMLKTILSQARTDTKELLGVAVRMKCWVKVRDGWRDNEAQLNNLGFNN